MSKRIRQLVVAVTIGLCYLASVRADELKPPPPSNLTESNPPASGGIWRQPLQGEETPDGENETATQEPEEKKNRSPLQRYGVTVTVLSQFEDNVLLPEFRYQKYKNVIDFVGHRGNWNFGAQLRSFIFSDRQGVLDYLPDNFEKTDNFTVYRKYVEYAGSGLQFRAGDFNQSLGNGITLFLQQDQTLRLDHTIEGGRFGFRWGRLETLVLGGVVDQATDDNGALAPQLLAEDRQDKILAARIVGHLPFGATVGVNANQFYYEDRQSDQQRVGSFEFKVAGLLKRFDVAGEFASTQRILPPQDPDFPSFDLPAEHGRAFYLALTGYVLGGTTLVEYKNYRDMESPYSNPPNLGRVDDPINNHNVRGFRVRFDRSFLKLGTTAYVSYTQLKAVDSEAPYSFPLPNFSTLIFAGLEQSLQDDRWYMQGSIARRYEKDLGLSETHGKLDVSYRFWRQHSLSANYDGRYTFFFLVREKDERLNLSYGVSPYLVFSVLMGRQYNVLPGSIVLDESKKKFFGPELVVTPSSAWLVRLFVGSLPGGLVCSGGICRDENAFRGFRSTVSYRF